MTKKGIGEIMGGQVLELSSGRIKAEGRVEGLAEGLAEGREEVITDFRKKTSELLSQGHSADEILKELGMFSQ